MFRKQAIAQSISKTLRRGPLLIALVCLLFFAGALVVNPTSWGATPASGENPCQPPGVNVVTDAGTSAVKLCLAALPPSRAVRLCLAALPPSVR